MEGSVLVLGINEDERNARRNCHILCVRKLIANQSPIGLGRTIMADARVLPKLKLKPKKMPDEYQLTNKRIVCHFRYLVVCFDPAVGGLVSLTKAQVAEGF